MNFETLGDFENTMKSNNPFPTESNIVNFPLPVEEPMPSIYIAGPMTGYDDYNRPLFNETAEAFEEGGWNVFNPATNDIRLFGSYEECDAAIKADRKAALRIMLGSDLEFICNEADAIAMLPGWEKSFGARAEHATAVALGLEIIYLAS
jgi:hypothetical protein